MPIPIILAGGKGERFWPLSREKTPKQCLKIISDKTMVEETIDRLRPISKKFYIVTNQHLADEIKKYVPDVNFVVEPIGRNTAAAIGLAAIQLEPDDIMFIETTDHYYKDITQYLNYIKKAEDIAKDNKIVLIGIKPAHPHTGFGYIHLAEKISDETFQVQEFKEKPDLKTAKHYIDSEEYVWNSGMFVFKASVILDAFKEHMPELYDSLMKIKENPETSEKNSEKLKSISIDYGIMEKSKALIAIKADMHWDDVGDWKAMEIIHKKDKDGNVIKTEHYGKDTKDCIIMGDKVVATLGVKELVIVNTKDAVLICHKDKAQDLKKLVQELPDKYKS